MTVQRYLQIQNGGQHHHSQQQQNSSNQSMAAGHTGAQQQAPGGNAGPNGHHRKLDRSLSEPKNQKGSQNGQNSNSSRYKTELCRPFEESGVCKYGDKCQFAHGYQELRTLTRHPKYKTELCCTFHTTGLCPYGSRCHFIHNPDENRAKILPPMSSLNQAQTQPSHGSIHQQQQQHQQHHQTPSGVQQQHQQHHQHAIGSSTSQPGSGQGVHHLKPLHSSVSSPAIGHGASVTSNSLHHHQQQAVAPPPQHHATSLRSLSLGSSVGSGSSGELSPSSSPGMFEDPFGASIYAPSAGSRSSLASNPLFSAFGGDLEMSTLAAAFSAAEGHANNSHGLLKNSGSAPVTPPFGSQLSLLSSSGPWSSPSSDMFHFPSAGGSLQQQQQSQQQPQQQQRQNIVPSLAQSSGLGGCGQLFADPLSPGQSSPVNSLTFDFDAISLGSATSSSSCSVSSGSLSPGSPVVLQGSSAAAGRINHSPLTRLPIFNKLAHSD